MTVTPPLVTAVIFTAFASISSAFISTDTARAASSASSSVSSASLLAISRSSSCVLCNSPLMTCPRTKRSPLAWVPNGHVAAMQFRLHASATGEEREESGQPQAKQVVNLKDLASQVGTKSSRHPAPKGTNSRTVKRPSYNLGVGKNMPLTDPEENTSTSLGKKEDTSAAALNWHAPEPAKRQQKQNQKRMRYDMGLGKNAPLNAQPGQNDDDSSSDSRSMRTTIRLLTKGDELSARLTKAVWDEKHFDDSKGSPVASVLTGSMGGLEPAPELNGQGPKAEDATMTRQTTIMDYQEIDLSIPPSVYSLGTTSRFNASKSVDLVWDLMRREAQTEAAREPLLVSFLYSTIINHPTLESALSFHLANRLSSPAMLSTQIMSLIREALDADPDFRRNLRADMLAVRDRDPACNCLPDVFLYFKGFHALQTYRVAHYLWRSGRRVLANYLQSQVSQHFQIDIHPNATLGSGIMLDHGTGIVIGETAHLGHNCSVLHHVTLGGSGRAGFDRHPKVGNGVLLGAGASVLGNILVGDGCQVGAGTLVIEDLPPRSVAVGVPAKIIGRFVDVTAQPSIGMNQLGSKEAEEDILMFGSDGI